MTAPAPLLTAAQTRKIETAAISSGAVSGWGLMRRAGEGCAAAAMAAAPPGGRIAVLCGPGNNGGDGYVAARLLAEAGFAVSVFALDGDRRPPDAETARAAWRDAGDVSNLAALAEAGPVDLLVDALFGAGLTRPLGAAVDAAWRRFEAGGGAARTLAVDAPSGLCLDSGVARGPVRRADLTVTFHRAKRGHYLSEGPALCGALEVVDIGLEPFASAHEGAALPLVGPSPALGAVRAGHKYDRGHALILAGGVGRGGAGRLAARAALRIGAGLSTLAAPGAALIENAARLDAVMLRRCDDAEALAALLEDRRITAVALGPGLGVGARTRALSLAALAAETAPTVVLDADALTSFAETPDPLFAALTGRPAVLTPHWGEFARLFPDIAAEVGRAGKGGVPASRVDAAEAAAARCGATVLLKGPDTVIAPPEGGARLHGAVYADAAPGLATAGSGDVLTGAIAGLAAQGSAPVEAASQGAWAHAAAARLLGPRLISDDLPEALPRALELCGRGPAAALGAVCDVG